MPEMDFLLNEKPSQWPGNILAVMLYPNDNLKRRQWLTASKARYWRDHQDKVSLPEEPEKLKEIIKFLADAPPFDKLFDQKAFNQGIIASEKLYTILEIDRSGIPPSAAKAEYLIDKDGLKSRSGKKIPSSQRSIQQAWKEYHSVAHLWAAYRIYHYLFSDDHFPLNSPKIFLSVSEFFRRHGERITPTNQTTPYLDPSTTWKPPENFKLGEININIPELSEDGLDLVDEYLDSIR